MSGTPQDQGRNDAQSGKGPKNTSNMPHQAANAYDAGYQDGKK